MDNILTPNRSLADCAEKSIDFVGAGPEEVQKAYKSRMDHFVTDG